MARAPSARKAPETSRCDHDHHAEEQRDRIEVDRADSVVEAERPERDHRRPAEEGDAGAVEPQPGDAADRKAAVGQRENGERGDAGRIHAPGAPATAVVMVRASGSFVPRFGHEQ